VLCGDELDEFGWAEVWSPALRRAAERDELRRDARVRVAYSNRTARGRLREPRATALLGPGST